MQNEYKLSVITVNYNGLKDTCALIESIPFNENMEVIVADNASKQNEANIIQKQFPQVKVIRSEKNLGFAGGNNLGIKKSKGKYLFLINNDTIFKEFNVDSLINRLESSPNIGIVLIQYVGYTPLSKITVRNQAIGYGEKDEGQYNTPHPTPYAHGAAMLIKREAIEKVGLMPEDYFLYYEEIDWSMMFTKAGYEIWYDPACTIYHKESQSTGQDSPLRTYYITRNRFLLVKRNWQILYKYLAYCYLSCIVASRDIIKHTLKGRLDLSKAVCKGIGNFIFNVQCSINK